MGVLGWGGNKFMLKKFMCFFFLSPQHEDGKSATVTHLAPSYRGRSRGPVGSGQKEPTGGMHLAISGSKAVTKLRSCQVPLRCEVRTPMRGIRGAGGESTLVADLVGEIGACTHGANANQHYE